MSRYNYKIADVVGRDTLANAIQEAILDGWEPVTFAFAGVKKVSQIQGAILPVSVPKNAALPIFVLMVRKPKESFTDAEKASFKDGIIKA